MDNWIETDELREATSAVEMFARLAGGLSQNPYWWRWAVVVLHAAMQGFMVCVLRGSNGLAVLPDKIAGAWLDARERGSQPPKEKLDSFLNLYSKTKGDRMRRFVHSRSFSPVGTQERNIQRLNRLRNEFTHYLPRCWALELGGLPAVCRDCLDYIDFLAFQSGNILWYPDDLQGRTRELLAEARRAIDRLETVSPTED
jgi:hypothetical protein